MGMINSYYREALKNIETGMRFLVRHDGQNKYAYVTRIGPDKFRFTSTTTNCRTIFTHMIVDGDYLRRKGITLPLDF
jgi:hypothetical protein